MKNILATLFALVLSSQTHALTYDSNVPKAIQDQMAQDLGFMNQVTGTNQTPFHKEIFGTVSGTSYKNFFESRITSVGLSGCGNPNAVACVSPFADPNKMWLTNNFIKFSHPQIARLMVVYHESRHSETQNGNWSHDTCPTPFLDKDGKDMASIWTGAKLAGQPACDSTYLGSYGSSTVLLKNISKFCSNCNSKVMLDADIYSTDQLGRIDEESVKKAMLIDFETK